MHYDYFRRRTRIRIQASPQPIYLIEPDDVTPVALNGVDGTLYRSRDEIGITWSQDGIFYRLTGTPANEIDVDELLRIARSME